MLYSMIRQIQARGVNIVTVEDPVEYRLQGIVQVQINEKTGLTFPAALRSILRQDPDVILVGEIRDRETAGIAIQASLTGHLVLTTLHTIDAASSVARLTDIGIEPYKVATALKGIVAQRLLRRLCAHCRAPVAKSAETGPDGAGAVPYEPAGCEACAGTGFRGRLAVTETLIPDAEVERRISGGESSERIADAARRSGMRSLWDSGVQHVARGTTAMSELMRVLEAPGIPPAVPPPPVFVSRAVADSVVAGSAVAGSAVVGNTIAGDTIDSGAFDLLDDHSLPRPAGASVLLVEDEAPLRRVLRDLLEYDGFVVHDVPDGVDALDAIDRTAPDIVVLDLNLPRLDGFGVLKHLKSREATRRIPVVVLTAKGDEDGEVRAFELGASEFVTKPFRPRALVARLSALAPL
jgi:CheY-like chemotaxis protein